MARRALGNLTKVIEDTRAVWTRRWLEDLIADLRFAVRTFGRKPGTTALIILQSWRSARALIRRSSSLVNAVLIRPLPYPDAGKVMTVWSYNRHRGFNTEQVSPADYMRTGEHAITSSARWRHQWTRCTR